MKMDKDFSILVGVVLGAISSFVSFLVGGIGLPLVVLLGLMCLDYITGLMVALSNGKFSYTIGIRGIIKKVYYLILIAAIYMLSLIVSGLQHAGLGVTIAIAFMEFASITDNGYKMNVYMPNMVKKIIELTKEKVGESNENSRN